MSVTPSSLRIAFQSGYFFDPKRIKRPSNLLVPFYFWSSINIDPEFKCLWWVRISRLYATVWSSAPKCFCTHNSLSDHAVELGYDAVDRT